MSRFDSLFVILLLIVVGALATSRWPSAPRPVQERPGQGLPAPSPPAPNAASSRPVVQTPTLTGRIRRPLLQAADAGDPTIAIETDRDPAGSIAIGTAFSIDQRGIWMTAHHVASEDCQGLILIVGGRAVAAAVAYKHPQSDLVIIETNVGAPALALSFEQQELGETGFSFGYPNNVLGATQDTLMGRSRMQLSGRLTGTTPTLTWAESSRFPDSLPTLGGMSGGPMFDGDGRVIGSVVAATVRRGRVHTVAPELLRQTEADVGLMTASRRSSPVTEIAGEHGQLEAIAKALDRNSRIAKVYCKIG